MDIKKYNWLISDYKRSNNGIWREEQGWNYYMNGCGWRQKDETPIIEDRWDHCIVLLGCSQTFGWAVNWEDTFASHLQNEFKDKQVVNLGKPGTSIERICKVLTDLRKRVNPWAIVINWPDMFRYYEWHKDKDCMLTHEIKDRDPELYEFMSRNTDYKVKLSNHLMDSARLMWSGKTHWVELTWSVTVKNVKRIESIDTGADDAHWGPKSHLLAFDYIKSELSDLL